MIEEHEQCEKKKGEKGGNSREKATQEAAVKGVRVFRWQRKTGRGEVQTLDISIAAWSKNRVITTHDFHSFKRNGNSDFLYDWVRELAKKK